METKTSLREILSLDQLEACARATMSEMAYAYIASGAADEITIKWNSEAYDCVALTMKVLSGVVAPDTHVSLFGTVMPTPMLLAPTAYHRVLHPEGELATARGAGASGTTWIVSSASTTSVEEIASVATAPLRFQLYLQSDRAFTEEVVERALAAGCKAVCLTVDTPVIGARNRQARTKFELPAGVQTPHLRDIGPRGEKHHEPAARGPFLEGRGVAPVDSECSACIKGSVRARRCRARA